MLTLGLSGHFSGEDEDLAPGLSSGMFHDAAACLIRDGELLAAVEEERYNRIKQTTKFPVNAIRACLAAAGASFAEIDAVGHYFEEDTVDRTLNNIYMRQPQVPIRSSREFIMGYLHEAFGSHLSEDRLVFTPHHVSHALSSFVRSGFPEALVVVMDAQGERHSTTVYRGHGAELEPLATYGAGKSLGNFYREGTHLLGYGMGDEYKVMGLAPYGDPRTYQALFDSVHGLEPDGEFTMRRRAELSWILAQGFKARRKGQDFTQDHMDFAAALQRTLERIVLHVLGHWVRQTGLRDLCFVGGVAQNSSLNGLILRSGLFREVFIHPASHDAGAAEGAALNALYEAGGPRAGQRRLLSASLGPDLGAAEEIEAKLAAWGALVEYERPADIVQTTAELLAAGAAVGWVHGRSEFGPRALGNRSILADARPSENKKRINAMVKKRESYRPFAPVVTSDAALSYFDLPQTGADFDFMSFVVPVREDRRELLGAVTHIDGSARVQVLQPESNPRFHALVERFGEITGVPVLLNTSFNNNAEPIVESTHDAVTSFLTTALDYLVVEDFLVRRRDDWLRAVDGLVVRFRPVTRIARQVRPAPDGGLETSQQIRLNYAGGPQTSVSPEAFAVLAAADGSRSLTALAGGSVDERLRTEIYDLWHARYIVLEPATAS